MKEYHTSIILRNTSLLWGYKLNLYPNRRSDLNLNQLKYIIETEKKGSFSKAATSLFISQPGLSNAIHELEIELGVSIFHKSPKGVVLTLEGQHIIQQAKSILFQIEELQKGTQEKNTARFNLITENYSYAIEAFTQVCKEYNNNCKLNFSISNDNLMNIIEQVSNFTCDLGVLFINDDSYDLCLDLFSQKQLSFHPLKKYTVNININNEDKEVVKNLKNGNYAVLEDYTFVQYKNEYNNLSYMPNLKNFNIIEPLKIISVSERSMKHKIISETKSFGIGCEIDPQILLPFNIESIPLPNNHSVFGYIKHKNTITNPVAKMYIQLLKEEINKH